MMTSNVVRHDGQVTQEQRAAMFAQPPLTLWLTGLSASGKSTLAYALERALVDLGRACYVLNGDNVRHGLNRDLGFSESDRSENIRRVAEVARLMNDAGLIVITAFISPMIADRKIARAIIGTEYFREVYVSTPLATCEKRDPKGLYAKARNGQIVEFTGVSAEYEPPLYPDASIDTSVNALQHNLEKMLSFVKRC